MTSDSSSQQNPHEDVGYKDACGDSTEASQ